MQLLHRQSRSKVSTRGSQEYHKTINIDTTMADQQDDAMNVEETPLVQNESAPNGE